MSRVYVGRLPPRCTERDIERFFKGYGRLRDVVLKNGYGFVEFDNEKDADDAVYDLHGREMRGERIIVEHARLPPGSRGGSRRTGGRDRRYGPPTRTEYRVLVENLSSRVSWQDLKDMMRKAGDVTYADAHKSQRNDGIVEFSAFADMKEAIEKFDGYELYGRKLRVYEDRSNRRSRSGSRRSRSGSRSRRRSNRSRSRDSYRRPKSRSPRRRRDRSQSSERHRSDSRDRRDSHRRSRGSGDLRSRSVSRRSASHHSNERSPSHRSDKHSLVDGSRSPSRNGREASAKAESEHHSRSRSASASRSRSRSRESGSPMRSRSRTRTRSPSHSRSASRSRSASNQSRSGSAHRSDEEMREDRQSEQEGADEQSDN